MKAGMMMIIVSRMAQIMGGSRALVRFFER